MSSKVKNNQLQIQKDLSHDLAVATCEWILDLYFFMYKLVTKIYILIQNTDDVNFEEKIFGKNSSFQYWRIWPAEINKRIGK